MSFVEAIASCLSKYANFDGRASRSEYWWFALFSLLVAIVTLVDIRLNLISRLLLLIPSLAVGARRLHDIGRSGWWLLLYFTIVGSLLLLYWAIKDSQNTGNEYGPPPNRPGGDAG